MGLVKELITKKTDQTVFSTLEISLLVDSYSGAKLHSAVKYAVKAGELIRITRGFYALSQEYSKAEFGNKYRVPSYVSLYTVLQEAGIVFQVYDSIFLVANRSEEVAVDGQKYVYRKIKDDILLNELGLVVKDGVNIASAERAICDKIYLDGDEYFDNIRSINWDLMKELNARVYGNSTAISRFISKNNK